MMIEQREEEDRLDALVFAYLEQRSCTPWHSIVAHFELHPNELLLASLERLLHAGRVTVDERREGYCSRRP